MNRVDIYLCGFSEHPFEGPVDGLQRVFSLSRPKAEGVVASLPQYVQVDLTADEAQPWVDALRAFGGQVEVHPHDPERISEAAIPPAVAATTPRSIQPASPTVSLSAPGASASRPPSRPASRPLSGAPSAPPPAHVSAAAPDLDSLHTSDRVIGSLKAPRAPSVEPELSAPPPRIQPQLSPSGRIMGSVRPPTMPSTPAPVLVSERPQAPSEPPIQPSKAPPVFEDVIRSQPPAASTRSSPAPKALWKPKVAYQSVPPPEPFMITVPVRAVLITAAVAAFLWGLYSLASP